MLTQKQVGDYYRWKYAAGWDEAKHPRADDGKFGSGGGNVEEKPVADNGDNVTTKAPTVSEWAEKKFKDPAHAKAFTEWFGDSKVVDESGDPLVVYHGTASDFEEFKSGETGRNWAMAQGWYMATSKASQYENSASDYATHDAKKSGGIGANVKPVFISLKNPLIVDASGYHSAVEAFDKQSEKIMDDAMDGDFDGVIVKYSDGSSDEKIVAASSSSQIKSATGNRGTFDPSDARITYARPRTC